MATTLTNFVKDVQLGSTTYPIAAQYIYELDGSTVYGHTWSDITSLISTAFVVYLCTQASDTPKGVQWKQQSGGSWTTITGTLEADQTKTTHGDLNTIYLVLDNIDDTSVTTYAEYIIVGTGSSAKWEMIGSSGNGVDPTNLVIKGVTYSAAAQSAGAHTHTTSVTTYTTKYLNATASSGGAAIATTATVVTGYSSPNSDTFVTGYASPSSDTFVKSYPGATSKLVTTTLTKDTASKVTITSGGTTVAECDTAVSNVVTGSISATEHTTRTSGDLVSSMTVDANGVLTVNYLTFANSSITPAKSKTIDSVSASSVNVASISSNTTVATGSLDAAGAGASVMTGLGTATTASAMTGLGTASTASALTGLGTASTADVALTLSNTQPTVTLSWSTTSGDVQVQDASTGTSTSITSSSDGAHTHDIEVPAS